VDQTFRKKWIIVPTFGDILCWSLVITMGQVMSGDQNLFYFCICFTSKYFYYWRKLSVYCRAFYLSRFLTILDCRANNICYCRPSFNQAIYFSRRKHFLFLIYLRDHVWVLNSEWYSNICDWLRLDRRNLLRRKVSSD
jgi:hypothetical protein